MRTRLECPLCGLDVLEPVDESEENDGESCAMHELMRLFSRREDEEHVRQAASRALARIDWWTPQEKSEFLEVLCGVAGMHQLEVVQKSDLRLEQRDLKVLRFSFSSFLVSIFAPRCFLTPLRWPALSDGCGTSSIAAGSILTFVFLVLWKSATCGASILTDGRFRKIWNRFLFVSL